MAPSRSSSSRKPVGRERSQAKAGARPRGGLEDLGEDPWEGPHAKPAEVSCPAAAGSGAVLEAVRKAAGELAGAEVAPGLSMDETLADPVKLLEAARWRGGSDQRRVTSLLARMVTGLKNIKPGWFTGMVGEPTPVQPLPLKPAEPTTAQSQSWKLLGWSWLQKVFFYNWRTLALVAIWLLFPRLSAMVIVGLWRMAWRAILAIMTRALMEVGHELRALITQFTLASTSFEETLMAAVDNLMDQATPSWSPSPASTTMLRPGREEVPVESSVDAGTPPSQPTQPWSFYTCLLLVVDIFLRHRAMGRAAI